ncbi:MAG: pilus assembly protein [Acidimicrobiales bacterium]|jgi:hypothetical protein|nr:pilus assembly protein [Acidimicrobiales bacterium]
MALPLVVLVLVLVLQVGLVARDQLLVVHAAREAVRGAAVAESAGDRAGAAVRAAHAAGGLPGTAVTTELLDGGRRVRATVRHTVRTDLPLVGALLPDVDLEASAVMRVEHPER